MSSYLCDKETFQRIAATIWNDTFSNNQTARFFGKDDFLKDLMLKMRDLNVAAYRARYGEDAEREIAKFSVPKFRYIGCSKMQAYKSLKCYLYQCCDGDCDKDPLYLHLERIVEGWAYDIISGLPEWDSLAWG